MTSVLNSSRGNRVALLVLWLIFYGSFTLFTPPLLDDADSVHAEVAREMLLRRDFVTLYANGVRYLEKAPLFYWAEAGCMRLFGVNTAATRVPLALSVLVLGLLVESFARRPFASSRAGLYAGLITLSSFGIFIFSRINIPDVLVCVLFTGALYSYFLSEREERPSRPICWLFAGCCAFNLLTKGLIGIVFPVGVVALHLWLTRGRRGAWRRLRQLHPLSSVVVFLVIAVPWHVLIAVANPGQGAPGGLSHAGGQWQVPYPTEGNVHGWAWFYFVNEQLYRYLNLRVPRDYDTSPLLLFYGLIFVWLMPWSAFLPSALARALPCWKRFQSRSLTLIERTNVLLLLWTMLPLLFFSLSTRQEYYVLPALPPMILLVAAMLAEGSHPVLGALTGKSSGRISLVLLGAGTLIALVLCVFLLHTRAPAPGTELASLLQQNPAEYALSFGHFLDLNARALGLFRLPLALTALVFFLGPLAHFLLRRAARPHAATLALAASAFVFLLAAHRGLVIFSPVLTSFQLAQTIAPQLRTQDLIAIHGEYEAGSTLGFYLRRNDLHLVEGRSSNLWYGSFFPDAPRIFETPASMAERWSKPQRIFLWQDPSDRERPVLRLPGPVYVLARSGGKEILSNQPNR